MRPLLAVLALLLATGCTSGKPLSELLPPEPHLVGVAGSLQGEYRVGVAATLAPFDLSWVRADLGEEAAPIVGYEHDGGVSLHAISPRGWVDRSAPFQLGVEMMASPNLPRVAKVSVALYPIEAHDETASPAASGAIARLVAHQGRLPARVQRALDQRPLGTVTVPPGPDGKTYKAVFDLDGKTAPWGARWYGSGADYVLSLVIVDEKGGVARSLLVTGPMALAEKNGEKR